MLIFTLSTQDICLCYTITVDDGACTSHQVVEYQPELNQWLTVGNFLIRRASHATLSVGPQQLPCLSSGGSFNRLWPIWSWPWFVNVIQIVKSIILLLINILLISSDHNIFHRSFETRHHHHHYNHSSSSCAFCSRIIMCNPARGQFCHLQN